MLHCKELLCSIQQQLREAHLIFSPHLGNGDMCAGGSTIVHVTELSDMVIEGYMTSGETGGDATGEGKTGPALAAAREAEARNAAYMLGISELIFLRFPDGGLICNDATFWAVRDIIERYQPYMYTSEYINAQYQHPDHIATGLLVHDAVESLNLREKPTMTIRYFDYWVFRCCQSLRGCNRSPYCKKAGADVL